MTQADDILFAPIIDWAAILRAAIEHIRNRPYQAGYYVLVDLRGHFYKLAYSLGSYLFGCPKNAGPHAFDSSIHHPPDCICAAISDADMLINLEHGHDLFDGAESPDVIRSSFYGDGG